MGAAVLLTMRQSKYSLSFAARRGVQNSDAPLHARGGPLFFRVCTGLPSGLSVLLVLREQRHRPTRRALLVAGEPCGAGDVEVRPLEFLGEAREEAGGGDGAAACFL